MPADLANFTDDRLAAEARAGSSACFEELVRRYEVRVLRFLLRSLKRPDAEDVLQETFAAAYLKLHQYDSRWAFKTWLFTIARRQAIDLHRKRRVHADVDNIDVRAVGDDPAHQAASRETMGRLWTVARSVLDDEPYQALWLHYGEDMGTVEIARVLGRSWVWVKTTLHRARRRLKPHLERLEGTDRVPMKAGETWQTT